MDDKQWQELAEEVLSGMKEWRQAHPKATFREIEREVAEQMSNLAMPEADTVLGEPGEELFRETRVEYSWDRQPTHQSQRAVLAEATLLNQMEQGIGQKAMRDALTQLRRATSAS